MTMKRERPVYKVVEGSTITELEKYVNMAIEVGYIPRGGVVAAGYKSYIQAMVLRPNPE